jgi:hypothetical protein
MSKKDEFIALRTSQEVKKLLTDIAEHECRTLSQQCNKILLDWLRKNGYIDSDGNASKGNS